MNRIKFKDVEPEVTIKNVKHFFDSNGFELKISESISEVGTYSSIINLMYNNFIIMSSNGKGMSADSALASGLAELYERFTLKMFILNTNVYSQLNKEKFKVVTLDYLSKFKTIGNYLNAALLKEDRKLFTSALGDDDVIQALPYTNISDGSKVYLNTKLLFCINTSTGLAAGNTYNEAFNQALSEIFERHVFYDVATNDVSGRNFYEISLDAISSKSLKDKLIKIKNLYEDVHVIDFSYTYKFPVVGIVIANNNICSSYMSLGCFPDFDIALERAITELYQNKDSLNESSSFIQYCDREDVIANINTMSSQIHCSDFHYVPAELLSATRVNTISDIWYNSADTNVDIKNYYVNLINNLNISLYSADYSLSVEDSGLYVVHLFSDDIPTSYINFNDVYNNLKLEQLVDISNTRHLITLFSIIKYSDKVDIATKYEVFSDILRILSKNELSLILSFPYFFSPLIELPSSNLNFGLLNNESISCLARSPEMFDWDLYNTAAWSDGYMLRFGSINRLKLNRKSNDDIYMLFKPFCKSLTTDDVINSCNASYIFNKCFIEPNRRLNESLTPHLIEIYNKYNKK